MKQAKRVRAESSTDTDKKQPLKPASSEAQPGQETTNLQHTVVDGVLDRIKSILLGTDEATKMVKTLMASANNDIGLRFEPFGPLRPPYEVQSARRLIRDTYKRFLAMPWRDPGLLWSLRNCIAFHPGLAPERAAIVNLSAGLDALGELADAEDSNERKGRALKTAEWMLAKFLKCGSDEPERGTLGAVLRELDYSNYEFLFRDCPASADLASVVKKILEAKCVMKQVEKSLDAL